MTQTFLEALKSRPILADGAMGTLLYSKGALPEVCFEQLNLTRQELVQQVHIEYINAGAELIETNSFSGSRYRLAAYGLEDKVWQINLWAAKVARNAREIAGQPTFVAGSVGPTGKLLAPLGDTSVQEMEDAFQQQMEALLAGGVDLFMIETMSGIEEMKAAVRAARKVAKLPVVAQLSFSVEGQTMLGVTPEDAARLLGDLGDQGPDVLGINCGAGPGAVMNSFNRLVNAVEAWGFRTENLMFSCLPNASLPTIVDGRFMYLSRPDYFASFVDPLVAAGARLLGGCCGTTPDHIRAMRQALDKYAQASTAYTKEKEPGPSANISITDAKTATPSAIHNQNPVEVTNTEAQGTAAAKHIVPSLSDRAVSTRAALESPTPAPTKAPAKTAATTAGPTGGSTAGSTASQTASQTGGSTPTSNAPSSPGQIPSQTPGQTPSQIPEGLASYLPTCQPGNSENRFFISVELDPPKGSIARKIIQAAKDLNEAGADSINVGDSPMARVRMSSMATCHLIQHNADIQTIQHFTTRDRNLMGIQADLLACQALGIKTILALTGDPPSVGSYAHATAVYDVDSIGLIKIISQLNQGADIAGNSIGSPTSLSIGCALNPTAENRQLEKDRFRKKLEAGAHFTMTQPIYQLSDLTDFLDDFGGCPVPILVGIMPLHSFKHAEYLHNEVPGITIPDHIRQSMQKAGDEGASVGLELGEALLEEVRSIAAGVYLVPSFGRYDDMCALTRRVKSKSTYARTKN